MTDVLYWMVYTLIVTSPSQIKNDQPRKESLDFRITGDASFHPGGVTCDARPKITLLLGKSGLGADT